MYGKNYGLTGQTVKVKHKHGDTVAYPWHGTSVPVLITAEYPRFLIGTILPHRVPKGFELSHPYTVSLDKHDIHIGVIIIEGGTSR